MEIILCEYSLGSSVNYYYMINGDTALDATLEGIVFDIWEQDMRVLALPLVLEVPMFGMWFGHIGGLMY